jgi:hypothetical protein
MSFVLRLGLSFLTLFVACASAQTAADLSSKYPVVRAYEVRPGILMILEKRHQTPDKTDLGSTIPGRVVDQLIEELVPPDRRGQPANRWLNKESHIGGGVADTERDFENVSIRIIGSISNSCDSGNEVVIIHWKKRTCAVPKQAQRVKHP